MNKEELADLLNGREYGNEITTMESRVAKENRLVAVFGYSDDNVEFRGFIHNEIGCYNGGKNIYISKIGLLPEHEDRCECEFCGYEQAKKDAKIIVPLWDKNGYSWVYSTEIPHIKFDIMEEGKPFCQGIVFSMDDISARHSH